MKKNQLSLKFVDHIKIKHVNNKIFKKDKKNASQHLNFIYKNLKTKKIFLIV